MKKWLAITAGSMLVLILLITLTPYFFKDQITREAKVLINDRVNADVNFEDIHLNLFKYFPRVGITFENVRVTGKGQFAGVDLLKAEGLTVGIDPWKAMFDGKTDIRRLKLIKPVIHVLTLSNEASNYNILIEDTLTIEDTTSTLNVALEKITIEDGNILYEDHSNETYIRMTGVGHTGKINVVDDLFEFITQTKVKEFTCAYGGISYIHRKELDLDMDMSMNRTNYRFTLKKNTISINHFKFSLDGSFGFVKEGFGTDMTFASNESSFKTILSLIPGVYKGDFSHVSTDGDVSFKGFVKGVYSDSLETIPAFSVDVKVKDGFFKVDTLPLPVTDVQLELAVKNEYGKSDSTLLDVKKIHAQVEKHSLNGRFKISGLNARKQVDADLFAYLDIGALQKVYPVPDVELKGIMNLEFKAKGDLIYRDGKLQKLPSFFLDMQVKHGKLKYDSLPSSVDDIQFHMVAHNPTGEVEKTSMLVHHLAMKLGENPVSGYVHINGYEKYDVDLDLKTSVDLSHLPAIFPMDGIRMKGIFDLDMRAKGVYDAERKKFPLVNAALNVKDGWLQTSDFPEPMEHIQLAASAVNRTGHFNDTEFQIANLTYTLEDEPFLVSGKVSDLNDYSFDLKIKGRVNLNKITKLYPVDGMTLRGIIDADFSTKGKVSDIDSNAYRRIKSEGQIRVRDFAMVSQTMPPVFVREADLSFTPEKLLLNKLQGKAGVSTVSMKGELTNYMVFAPKRKRKPGEKYTSKKRKPITGDLVLICDTLDINEWMAQGNGTSTGSVAATAADTSAQQTSAVIKISERIDFVFDSRIGFVKYMDLQLKDLSGEIKVKDGIMSLKETTFNLLDAKFTLTGDYDTRDITHPLVDFSIDIKELDIQRAYKELAIIRELAPAAGDTYGSFSMNYFIKGELDQELSIKNETIIGGGEIRVANAKINGMKVFEEVSRTAKKDGIKDPHLKDFVMTTEIRDNKIFIKPFSLKISGLETDIEGVSEMSGAIRYIFRVELLPIEKLKIPFHVTGTYDNPKVALGKGHTLPGQ